MKKFILILLIGLSQINISEAKAYKGWLCHFWTGFVIKGDKCKKGPSDHKFYFARSFKNKDGCYAATQAHVDSPEMQRRYPVTGNATKDYMYGCDKKWKR